MQQKYLAASADDSIVFSREEVDLLLRHLAPIRDMVQAKRRAGESASSTGRPATSLQRWHGETYEIDLDRCRGALGEALLRLDSEIEPPDCVECGSRTARSGARYKCPACGEVAPAPVERATKTLFAARLGISRQTVNAFFRGDAVTPDTANVIFHGLGLEPSEAVRRVPARSS